MKDRMLQTVQMDLREIWRSVQSIVVLKWLVALISFMAVIGAVMTRFNAKDTPYLLYILLCYVVTIGLGITFSRLSWTKKVLFWIGTMTLWLSFVTPPFDSPDEDNHFYRTLHIYDGNWGSPTDVKKATLTNSFKEMDAGRRRLLHESKIDDIYLDKQSERIESRKVLWTSYNISLFYIPSLLGVITANILGLTIWWMLLFARLFNGIAYMGIVYLVLKTTQERYKYLFSAVLTIPFFVFLAGTVNLDALSLALTCLALAKWLNLLHIDKIDRKELLQFIGLIVLVSLSKLPYILLLGLVLPLKGVKNRAKIWAILGGIGLTVFWFSLARTANTGMYINADPVKKFLNVLQFGDMFRAWTSAMIAEPMYLFEVVSYQWTTFSWLLYTFENHTIIRYIDFGVLLQGVMFSHLLLPANLNLSKSLRRWLFIIGLGIAFAVVSVGFFMWSDVGRPDTQGSLQARYMIVPWLLFGLAFNVGDKLKAYIFKNGENIDDLYQKYILVFSITLFITGAVSQLVRYYTGF